MQSIFSTTNAAEDRQICEQMISKNMDVAQRENILFLTGVSHDSPYYSPPAPKKRSIIQFFIRHALKFATRVENPPSFPSISAPASVSQASCLSKTQVVPSGCDPLSTFVASTSTCDLSVESPAPTAVSTTQVSQTVTPTFVPYQLVLSQAGKLFSWRKPCVADAAPLDAAPLSSAPAQRTTESYSRQLQNVNVSTGFVNSSLRSYLFDSEVETLVSEVEMTPLLTPLQRAISQAREHGYHLHPRQPLAVSSSSPLQHSPPGLAHLKHRYNLRSHQVAAGDYFRKEASHRAAVAARNLNRHQLIRKSDRSLYEPTGIIMPDYEITRLRVVLAPKRFPVRLWKKEYRGPADWIEIEERTPTGSPVIFKRDSHLRKELPIRLKRVAAQRLLVPALPPKDKRPPTPVATVEKAAAVMVCPLHQVRCKPKLTLHKDQAKPVEPVKQDPPSPTSLRLDIPATAPTCIDAATAEAHRQAVRPLSKSQFPIANVSPQLLKKYYNPVPKPAPSPPPKNVAEPQLTNKVKLKVVDPSSSEETLCELIIGGGDAEAPKDSEESPKEALKSIISSNVVKLRTGSDPIQEDRHARLSLSPRRALRAVKNQAKSLGF